MKSRATVLKPHHCCSCCTSRFTIANASGRPPDPFPAFPPFRGFIHLILKCALCGLGIFHANQ